MDSLTKEEISLAQELYSRYATNLHGMSFWGLARMLLAVYSAGKRGACDG